jgi:hypothetical protein
MWPTRMRQVHPKRLRLMRHIDSFVESLVSALQDLFVKHDVSVSYEAIPRRLSPSIPSTATEHDNLRLSSSGDVTPILYVGSTSLGLTNLLMTNPSTPVCNSLRSPGAYLPFLHLSGLWIRPRDTRGHASIRTDE